MLGSLGTGAMGMSGMWNADLPETRKYANELQENVAGQTGVAPKLFGAEAEYQPKYAGLSQDVLSQMLLGGGGDSGGLLNLLLMAQKQGRQGEAGDLAATGGDLSAGVRGLAPGGYGLLDDVAQQERSQLDEGLSPGELRDVQQNIRGAQASRGVGYGPRDTFDEIFGTTMAGRQVRNDAADRATRTAQASIDANVNPVLALFRSGGATGTSALGPGMALMSSLGPKLFNPEDPYGERLQAQTYSSKLQNNQFNAQLAAGYAKMMASGGDSLSSMGYGQMLGNGGGGMSGPMGGWSSGGGGGLWA